MSAYRYPIIAREGWLYVGLSIAVAVIATIYSLTLASMFWVFTGILVFFFRDPHRVVPASPLGVISPVQGKIETRDVVYNPILEDMSNHIKIKVHWYNVLSLRSPMEGKIVNCWYHEQTRENNIHASFLIESDENDQLALSISGGFLWWKPNCVIQSGERVGQGQRCGFMRFGTVVDIFLPQTAKIKVGVGDKVTSGESIIAELRH